MTIDNLSYLLGFGYFVSDKGSLLIYDTNAGVPQMKEYFD